MRIILENLPLRRARHLPRLRIRHFEPMAIRIFLVPGPLALGAFFQGCGAAGGIFTGGTEDDEEGVEGSFVGSTFAGDDSGPFGGGGDS